MVTKRVQGMVPWLLKGYMSGKGAMVMIISKKETDRVLLLSNVHVTFLWVTQKRGQNFTQFFTPQQNTFIAFACKWYSSGRTFHCASNGV